MFKNEACGILKNKELTFVNDCFEYERNEDIGHYRQTLIMKTIQQIQLIKNYLL